MGGELSAQTFGEYNSFSSLSDLRFLTLHPLDHLDRDSKVCVSAFMKRGIPTEREHN